MDREEYMMALASSFMISADNAHAVHPNHQEKGRSNKQTIYEWWNCY